jgi:enamine deaminase RidA (YjgF/YER057c/UK114 family)
MSIQQVISADVTEPARGMWSNCLKVNDTLYISGLTARNKLLQAVAGDEYEQASVIFRRMRALIESGGGSMSDVVKLTIFVTRIAEREKVWRARRECFAGVFPAASLVEVSALAEPEIRVEIEAIAVLNQGGRPVG